MGDRTTAINHYNQAASASNDKSNPQNLTTAYNLFVSSVYADSTYWLSHYQCGNNVADLGHHHAAIAEYRRALQCEMTDAERSRVCANICDRLRLVGRATESNHYGNLAVVLDPTNQAAWVNLSVVQGILRLSKVSLQSARRAYDLDPDNMGAQMALSFALLFDRQYVEGLDAFECRYRYALHSFTQFPYPKWRGEKNARVMIVADQGLGDSLDYARFIPAALKRAKYVHLAVHSELMRCFQDAFLKYDNIEIIPLQPTFRQADYYTSMVSLPWSLKLTQDEIVNTPQIVLPSSGVASMYDRQWMNQDAKLHIGIAWGGSRLNDINKYRSIPVTTFLELYRVPGIQLYSLQVNSEHSSQSKEMHDLGCAASIRDLTGYIRDVSDTVSFLQHLDLVISCESALPHICAAVGRECWIPYSFLGRDYRAGHSGEVNLWAPKHRFFLQNETETWDHVFERIVVALEMKTNELARKTGSEAA